MDSFIGWIGGKKALRDKIIARFPDDPPERYIEVCGGAGWVFFRKDKVPGQLEIFNDINSDLINLYRCIKYHSGELQRTLDGLPPARELFNDFKAQMDSPGLTDIQRAARYLYLVKVSFGSDHDSFATSRKTLKALERFPEIQSRLDGVILENRDFERLIKIYDRLGSLFYVDPPYVSTEDLYADKFKPDDHERLCRALKGLKGRFILSYNDCESVRKLYSWAKIEGVTRKNQLYVGSNSRDFAELIIRNYD